MKANSFILVNVQSQIRGQRLRSLFRCRCDGRGISWFALASPRNRFAPRNGAERLYFRERLQANTGAQGKDRPIGLCDYFSVPLKTMIGLEADEEWPLERPMACV
jgi:hypothetical protein